MGDKGKTRLFSGEWVWKDSPRPDAYGDIDELVSCLGVARVCAQTREAQGAILGLQRALFVVGAELAVTPGKARRLARRVGPEMVAILDRRRAALEARVELPHGFIMPGENPGAACLDFARAIARRAERKIVGLARRGQIRNPHLLVWMNRLSDYLWLLARHEEQARP